MVEYARFAQCQSLEEKGWTIDEECRRLQIADDSCGGPSYMRAPDGKLYAVSCGTETPISGLHNRWSLEMPADLKEQREQEQHSGSSAISSVVYRDGRIVATEVE